MRKIASEMLDYDLIAVQEISNIREKSDEGCPRNEDDCPGDSNCDLIRDALELFLNEENSARYEFVFSDQVKDERYLFVYNPAKVSLVSAELVEDVGDSLPICDSKPESSGRMVRQPFMGKFKVGSLEFTLLTAHTSPSINVQELEGLEWFFDETAKTEENVIVLGDLNADCSYLKASDNIAFRDSKYVWVVDDSADTTVAKTDCAYDRFIFMDDVNEHYTGNWGVVSDIPDDVSDHYLVWAEFSV